MKRLLVMKAVCLAAVVALTACGGGSGGTREARQVPEPQAPQSLSESDTIKETLNRLIGEADTLIRDQFRSGFRFDLEAKDPELSLSDIVRPLDETEFVRLESRNGISFVRGESGFDGQRTTYKYTSDIGYLNHSFFYLQSTYETHHDPLDRKHVFFSHPYSLGDAPGSNPTVAGIWEGFMIGTISSRAYEGSGCSGNRGCTPAEARAVDLGNFLEGDASVSVVLGGGGDKVSVSFINIVDPVSGTAYDPLTWRDISMTDGGFSYFENDSKNQLSGSFYGPKHEEVGGVFLRNNIEGVFGAKR